MFRDLIQLILQLRRDDREDETALRRRDRTIGHKLSHLAYRPQAQLRAWLPQVANKEDVTRARQGETAGGLVAFLLAVIGLAMGGSTAAALFYYDGTNPVNILPVLAVFVFLPLLLLVPLCIAIIPAFFTRRLPLLNSLQESLSMLLAGLIGIVMRLLPQQYRDLLQQTVGRASAHRRVYGRFHKWILLRWSQWFTVVFYTGAIVWFGYLIVSRDLAFTWSTTIEIEARQIHRITQTLALPWSSWLAPANPSEDLIKRTRYFRLGEGVLPQEQDSLAQAKKLGRWWPFLLACMITYGLLPRMLTLAVAMGRCRAVARWSLLHTPGAADVLDRLNNVVIETGSPEPEQTSDEQTLATVRQPQDGGTIQSRECLAVNWSEVPLDDKMLHHRIAMDLGYAANDILDVGGLNTFDDDERVIQQVSDVVGSNASGAGTAVVVVKAWEPPVMDFVDFVRDLRQALGDGVRIVVAPVYLTSEMSKPSQNEAHLRQWQKKMETLGDPWLQVHALNTSDDKKGRTDLTVKEATP